MRGLWALAFVVVALAALVALPVYFGQRVEIVQDRISNVLEPAARLSANLRLVKTRQMARVEGFILTRDPTSGSGDPSYREFYNAAIAEEDAILAELRVLAQDLDIEACLPGRPTPCIFERVARLTTESTNWRFSNERVFESGGGGGAREAVVSGYDSMQRATRDLDLAILALVDEGRRKVANERRLQARIMGGLAMLGLLATLVVARVAYRYRDLTVEGEKRRREAVRARREIDALLAATGDGVLGIDLEGRCTSLNRAGAQLLGYTESEITGRDVHATLFHTGPEGVAEPREDSTLLKAVAEGRALESGEDAIIWRRKRVPFPARWSLLPMIDGTELRGAVLTFTDMTQVHENQQALRLAVRQREDVVSIVSHDLRNPLGVALAAADLLLDLPLDEQQRRRQAEIIRRSGKRMQHLIEDLLDVARIEAGALVVRPSLEDLVPILEEAIVHYQDQANARGVRLQLRPPVGEPRARVDRDRIMQALTNLLDNAIRLTPEGGAVIVSVTEKDGFAHVAVQDTGPGVPPDMVDRLFDRFAQGEGRDSGAAGLGLTIVRGVANAHDGSVTVSSVHGKGATFTLRLPRRGPAVGEEGRAPRGADANGWPPSE
jgi:PAS domain S-box-containing protein